MHRREFIRTSILGAGASGVLGFGSRFTPASPHSPGSTTVLHNGIVLPDPFPPRLESFMDGRSLPPYLVDPPAVVRIDTGRQLFVDDFLVETSDGLSRTAHRPHVDRSPLISPEYGDSSSFERSTGETVLTHFAAPYSDGVWWDAYRKQYRAWLLSGQKALAHAESSDGVDWRRTRHGSEPAIIMRVHSARDSGTVWIDSETEDPAERYKMSHFSFADKKNWLYASPDGLTWPDYDQPLARTAHYAADPAAPFGDRTTFFRDPFRKKWIWSLRDLVDLRSIGGRRYNRVRRFAEADDLLRQPDVTGSSTPWLMQRLDLMPDIQPQLYNLDAIAYESVMLYLLSVWTGDDDVDLRSGTAAPKENAIGLGFSRDGFHLTRLHGTDGPFIRRGDPESWNEGNVQSVGGGVTIAGPAQQEELFIYFTARENRVSTGGRIERWGRMGRARLRRDGFASMRAGQQPGTLTTRPLRFDHEDGYLFVNVDASEGQMLVEVLDDQGSVVAGYDVDQCVPVSDDSTRRQVSWRPNRSLGRFGGRPIRLRFHLHSASLFSFWISPDQSGISNGFLAAGGPAYPGYRDLEAAVASGSIPDTPQPRPFQLLSNAPNPFADYTDVKYRLDTAMHLDLGLFDPAGRRVATIAEGIQSSGIRVARLNGRHLAAGVYLIRMQAGGRQDSMRIVKTR